MSDSANLKKKLFFNLVKSDYFLLHTKYDVTRQIRDDTIRHATLCDAMGQLLINKKTCLYF